MYKILVTTRLMSEKGDSVHTLALEFNDREAAVSASNKINSFPHMQYGQHTIIQTAVMLFE